MKIFLFLILTVFISISLNVLSNEPPDNEMIEVSQDVNKEAVTQNQNFDRMCFEFNDFHESNDEPFYIVVAKIDSFAVVQNQNFDRVYSF